MTCQACRVTGDRAEGEIHVVCPLRSSRWGPQTEDPQRRTEGQRPSAKPSWGSAALGKLLAEGTGAGSGDQGGLCLDAHRAPAWPVAAQSFFNNRGHENTLKPPTVSHRFTDGSGISAHVYTAGTFRGRAGGLAKDSRPGLRPALGAHWSGQTRESPPDLGPEGQQRPSQPVSQSLRPPALGLGRPLASTSTHSLQTASDEIIKSMVSWSTPPSLSPALAACPHKHPRPVSGPACPGPSTQSGGTWVARGVGDTCDDTHPGWRRHLAPAGRAAGHTDPISLRG